MATTVNLYAVCTINNYTVTANANGGSIASTTGWTGTGNTATKQITYESTYGTLPTVSRTGYTFKGWSLLPNGFTQVEYIQSTGTQYIDTGAQIFNKDSHEIVMDMTPTEFYNYNQLFGSTCDDNTFEAWIYSTGNLNGRYNGAYYGYQNALTVNTRYLISHSKQGANLYRFVDGTLVSGGATNATTSTTTATLTLFKSGSDYSKFKLYASKIYANGELVRDFVPCINNSTGKAGLYDLITNTFYGNDGTGDFVAGNTSYLTSSTAMTTAKNHNIYAHWTANTYTVVYNNSCDNNKSGSMANSTYTYDTNGILRTNAFTCNATVTYNYNGATGGNSTASTTVTSNFLGWTVGGPNLLRYRNLANSNYMTIDDTDGTLSFDHENTTSSEHYANFFFNTNTNLETSTKYVYVADIKSLSSVSAYNSMYISQANTTTQLSPTYQTVTYTGVGLKYHNTETISDFTSTNYSLRGFMNIGANKTRSMKFRPILFKGTYNGTDLYYYNAGTVRNLAPSGTVNLYADWTYETPVTLPSPTKTGYTFNGWYSDSSFTTRVGGAGDSYTPSVNKILYAKWTPNTYTIKYNGNGNTGGSTANSSHTYDVAKALTTNGFTKTGYTFAGWSTSASDKNLVYDNSEYVAKHSSGSYTDFKSYRISGPFESGEVYQLEFDFKGGSASNYFYGDGGYLSVANVTQTDGTTTRSGSSGDGYNYISSSTDYKHYSVRFTLGSTGNGSVDKIILFRTTSTDNVYIKNIRFFKVSSSSTAYVDGQVVKNLTATNGATVNLYALWTDLTPPSKPTVTLKHTADDTAYTSDTWTNKQVYSTITSTDAGTGVTEIYYSFDNSTWTKLYLAKSNGVQHSGTSYYGSEVWNDTDGRNITVYFKTKDAAGNYSAVSDPVKIKYDKSGPTITASNINYGSNLSITLADAYSGVVGWQVTSSSTAPTSGWTSVTKTASTTVTKSGLVPGTYYVWSIDDVGNKSSKQITVSTKPVTVTAGSTSRAWNGSALTNNTCTAGSNQLLSGHTVTCTMTSASTITVASTTIGQSASVNNVIDTVTIKDANNNNVTSYYNVTKANGTLTISYATPTISLTAKTANWTGSTIAANAASASPNSSPTFSYVYYTDSSCSTQTTTSHGASAAGGAPSLAGQYYVKANAAAVSTKTNAASSACTSHKINAPVPTVTLTAKEATYTGSAIAANTATVSPNSNPTITYTYYTDSGCSTKTGTTVATGLAASAGAAPVVAGQYYVKASAAAVSGKTAAGSSACVSHKITPKAVTVTAGSDSRAWNGSALTKSSCTANSLGTGDAVTCTMTSASTITLASTTIGTSASVNNVINTVTIKKGANDVSASYTITKANGTLTISYANPTISLTAKTANWNGSAIAANTATASPNSSPTMTYTYYTNNTCTTTTTTSHGASANGGAPSLVGNYYVKASAAAVSQKTNAATSGCIAHTITASTPTVSLSPKEATYTGAAITANTATVSPNSNPTITYAYYTDSGCSTATTAANSGAASNGAAPVYAGQYYVKASAAAVSGKTGAGSSSCVSHKINKKAITVTAGTSSRAWNGSALTNSGCTASALGTGDSVTCTMTSGSTITLASTTIGTSASQTNTIDTVTIKKGTVNVSNSYTITKATGTLTISYANPTVTLSNKETAYTGSAISINAPTISPNSNPTLTYNYYTNSTCTTTTSTSNSGAAGTGKPPVYAGQYYAKVSATAVSQKTNAADSNCASLKITKITCPAPTGVSITTAGVVSWTAASGASSYQISIDNTNWTAASSGVNYKNTITAATGSRTVYVRSVCSATNYTSTSSANGTASVTVYSVSLTKGTGISAVSGAGNYISGATAAIDATVTAGYTWANWTGTSTLTQKANNITVNGNKSYTANTTANTYTVVYNGNGNTGGSTASSTHTYGVAKNLTSNGFTKDGYAFAGWATSASGAVAYSNGQSVSNLTTTNGGTVNLYAKWNQSTYTMTINPNGGTYNSTTSTSSKTMKYDATDNNDIGVPTYSGYTFQGWYTAQSGGSLIYGTNGKNVALNGYWDAAYNTGKWKKAGNITIWARWSITDPGIPTITGGTTKIYGASATTLTCTENTSYPSGFTKYYEFGYATSSTGTPSSWVASSNNQYTISTAAGTEFVGTRYYKCRVHVGTGSVNSNNVVSTSPTTMTINNATITLSAGSGATACSTISGQSPAYVNTSMTGVYNSVSGTGSGTIPTASKNGYSFSGFYDGNTQVINGSGQIVANVSGWTDNNKKWTITANKTLTAKCSENSYSISYTMNNGTCTTTPPTSYTINSSAITLPTSCSKTISFVPHYSTNASSNATASSGVSYGNTTTAQQTWTGWTGSNGTTAQKTVTIPAGSTGNKSYALRFTAVAGTLPTVTRGGYTCGWNANDGQTTRTWGSGGTYATGSITEGMSTTVNLYAVCNPNTYKVSFSRNCPSGTGSGGQTADVTATYNAAMPAISTTAPTCSYYTFDGWYDTSAASGGNKYYTAAGASNRSWDKTAATTLYGRWIPVNYTISYNLNNCGTVSGTNPTSYNYASAAITLKNPSKTGYTFTGWTGSNGTTAQTTVTIPNHSNGNKSYTANCTINKYYIDLNAVIGGKSAGNTSGCGKVDVYINNSKVSSQVTDFYQQYNYGTTWKIQNITTSNPACSRSGLATSYSGTVGTSNVNIGVQWSVPVKAFRYTGGMQSYTVPVTGNYRLIVYGAQGNRGYGVASGYTGGKGGKSVGVVNSLAAGTTLYIGVGGGGSQTANGGYNGGGSGNYIAGDNGYGGGGGGATHMAKTQSALLRNTTPANVYIVAGGGGGSSEASYDHSTWRSGGTGGGTSGGNGSGGSYIGGGGSQDHIGTRGDSDCTNAGFGYGGSSPYGSTTESTYAAGGGGAGWYGGGASSHSSGGTYSTASSGAGGSGRLSGYLASGATTTNGQQTGNGYASIDLVG